MTNNKQAWVVCAAIKHKDTSLIICGARHFDMIMHGVIKSLAIKTKPNEWEQGFINQWGVFYSREEAAAIAEANKQPFRSAPKGGTLYSEDLY